MAAAQLGSVLQHIRKLAAVHQSAELTDGQLLEGFATRHEEAAFTALVQRHGPMVLGVCRRVLRNPHDAEDAFQATFLILVRKAGSIGRRESLSYWLHEVAYRTALRAKFNAAKRRVHERQALAMSDADPLAELAWRDVQPLLDAELQQLPEKYRAPFILCYLEGKTHAEAAQQLGWPKGTVSGRLARARDLLRARLAQRGLVVSSGALAAALAHNAVAAAVPCPLVVTTVKAALVFAAGKTTAAGMISAQVASLVEGGLKAMVLTKLKIATALVLAVGVLTSGTGVLTHRALAAKQVDGPLSDVTFPAAPPPGDQKPAPGKEVTAEEAAAAILEKHIAAIGGRDAWKAVSSVEVQTEGELFGHPVKTVRIEDRQTRRFYNRTEGPSGTTEMGFDGQRVWQKSPFAGGYLPKDDPAAQRLLHRPPLLHEYRESGRRFVRLPDEKLVDKEHLVVESTVKDATGAEFPVRYFFDPDTYLLKRTTHGRAGAQTTDFGDYQEVDGRMVAFSTTAQHPQANVRMKVTSVRHNVPLEPTQFEYREDPAPKGKPGLAVAVMRFQAVPLSGERVLAATPLAGPVGPAPVAASRDEVLRLAAQIDKHLAARWAAAQVEPAAPTDDAEFLRRVYLDIAGRIPSVAEARAFLDDKATDKRLRLVEELLQNPRYVVHFTNVWRALMLPEANTGIQGRLYVPGFEAWLRKQLARNLSYDQMVREVLTTPVVGGGPPGAINLYQNPGEPTPVAYYLTKEVKPENLAASTARLFLGVRLECAQCHDHPFADWKRDQFWSYAAFFSGLEASRRGDIAIPAREVADRRELTIPGSNRVVKASFLDGTEPVWKPSVGTRAILADWMTTGENPYFTRAAVNRLWAHFFGVGLTEPVEDMIGSETVASHPELLTELARDFTAHRFDVKFLIRALTASRAYQMTSAGKAPEDPQLFARMPLRGLSPEQLFDSLVQATGYQETAPMQRRIVLGPNDSARARFLEKFAQQTEKPTEVQTSILQALALMNGKLVADSTSLERSETLTALAEAPFMDAAQRIEALYLATLSRKPRSEEMARLVQFVEKGNPKEALADVFWALLNSSEFILNH
jgi:RNA polymerase sigma factor (sigma-70 family)